MIKDIEKEVQEITKWIKEYVEKSHSKGVVVGNSGGKDSAVVIALATKALGKENVVTIDEEIIENTMRGLETIVKFGERIGTKYEKNCTKNVHGMQY